MYNFKQHLHFIGIGGVGMAGIAEILVTLGYSVSGSDIRKSSYTEHLAARGVKISIGHAAERLPEATTAVVVSTAIDSNNEELLAARERGLIVLRRAEMLAELMRMKNGIAISGSHGKTTTTSLIGHVLSETGVDPTVIVGGRVLNKASGARLGSSPYLVAEADESDGSFSCLTPSIAVVTNIDSEHLGYYGGFGALEEAFFTFMSSVPFYGLVIACVDDPVIAQLLPRLRRRYVGYGFGPESTIQASEIRQHAGSTEFKLQIEGEATRQVVLPVPGRHMVQNALAAIAVARELECSTDEVVAALKSFSGVARRSEVVGRSQGVIFIDDYAHHPTEIVSTLSALKAGWCQTQASEHGASRLIVVFQPHRFSRTKELFHEFVTAFGDADEVVLGEIYPAGEAPIEGISGVTLAESLQHNKCSFVKHLPDAVAGLSRSLRAGDVVVTLGAGDVGAVSRELLKTFAN